MSFETVRFLSAIKEVTVEQDFLLKELIKQL